MTIRCWSSSANAPPVIDAQGRRLKLGAWASPHEPAFLLKSLDWCLRAGICAFRHLSAFTESGRANAPKVEQT